MEVKLIVNGVEKLVGIEFLIEIANSMTDISENQDIFFQLANHSSATVRQRIAYKSNLDKKTAKLLLQDRDTRVLETIVRNQQAIKIFDNEDFEHILKYGNEDTIAEMISSLMEYECLDNLEDCYKKIEALNNDYLILKIASSYGVPKKILKNLSKHKDIDISNCAKNSLV